jgi:hypothetical protein
VPAANGARHSVNRPSSLSEFFTQSCHIQEKILTTLC